MRMRSSTNCHQSTQPPACGLIAASCSAFWPFAFWPFDPWPFALCPFGSLRRLALRPFGFYSPGGRLTPGSGFGASRFQMLSSEST